MSEDWAVSEPTSDLDDQPCAFVQCTLLLHRDTIAYIERKAVGSPAALAAVILDLAIESTLKRKGRRS